MRWSRCSTTRPAIKGIHRSLPDPGNEIVGELRDDPLVEPPASLTALVEAAHSRLLTLIALFAIAIIVLAVTVAHRLWERSPDPSASHDVLLFNLVTIATLFFGIAFLYLTLFSVSLVASILVIDGAVLAEIVAAEGCG